MHAPSTELDIARGCRHQDAQACDQRLAATKDGAAVFIKPTQSSACADEYETAGVLAMSWRSRGGILPIALLGALALDAGEAGSVVGAKAATIATGRLAAWAQTPAEWERLEDRRVGYALRYPAGWSVGGRVAATEFAVGARCRSVRVVDFEPPADAGPGAQVRQSFVQVCAKPLRDGAPLEDFMRRTYGALLASRFEKAELNGMLVYRSTRKAPARLIFTQTADYRIQLYSSVTAAPEDYARRLAQVEEILASFSRI